MPGMPGMLGMTRRAAAVPQVPCGARVRFYLASLPPQPARLNWPLPRDLAVPSASAPGAPPHRLATATRCRPLRRTPRDAAARTRSNAQTARRALRSTCRRCSTRAPAPRLCLAPSHATPRRQSTSSALAASPSAGPVVVHVLMTFKIGRCTHRRAHTEPLPRATPTPCSDFKAYLGAYVGQLRGVRELSRRGTAFHFDLQHEDSPRERRAHAPNRMRTEHAHRVRVRTRSTRRMVAMDSGHAEDTIHCHGQPPHATTSPA